MCYLSSCFFVGFLLVRTILTEVGSFLIFLSFTKWWNKRPQTFSPLMSFKCGNKNELKDREKKCASNREIRIESPRVKGKVKHVQDHTSVKFQGEV